MDSSHDWRASLGEAASFLDAAATALAAGGVVCFPTESSYGLAARLDRPAGCSLIARLKERESNSPFPVIAADLESAKRVFETWPKGAADLANKHWPGPLTLVLGARAELPVEVVGPGGGVGVRVSPHPIASALAKLAGPITATSANRRGAPPALNIADAQAAFAGESLFYLDGGECIGGAPSTVVSISAEGERSVLRHGAIELV